MQAGRMRFTAADEIRNLLHRYAELIDDKDVDGLQELFAHAVIDSDVEPGEWRGRLVTEPRPAGVAELVVFRSALHPHPDRQSAHVCTNAVIELDTDDRARARSRFTVFESEAGAAPRVAMCGRYHDAFEQSVDGWRFVGRRFFVDIAGQPHGGNGT
jgi:3-phenylpropionate/cinnamic acid dioxygenase small subunit